MSWFDRVAASVKQGATDLARGVQGKETGRTEELLMTFTNASLGMTVSDYGGEGMVSALAPGGEAGRVGVALNDRVVRVGDVATASYRQVVDAIRAHPRRPLEISVERRRADESLGLVAFRLDEECVKAKQILAKMVAATTAGPPKAVLKKARGLAFFRVRRGVKRHPKARLRDASAGPRPADDGGDASAGGPRPGRRRRRRSKPRRRSRKSAWACRRASARA